MRKKIIYPTIITILTGLLLLSHLYAPVIAQPGTSSDPLVTQRYVDERIAQLQAQIDLLESQIAPPTGGISQAQLTAIVAEVTQAVNAAQVVPFTPLFVPRGSTLIAEAGVEFILRSGTAYVIAGPNGIVDVTAGIDIANGQRVSQNHLMLVPATDGRGLYFATGAWLMIKGGYIIGY